MEDLPAREQRKGLYHHSPLQMYLQINREHIIQYTHCSIFRLVSIRLTCLQLGMTQGRKKNASSNEGLFHPGSHSHTGMKLSSDAGLGSSQDSSKAAISRFQNENALLYGLYQQVSFTHTYP